MIVSRAPLRISLAGGGTDLPAYADKFGMHVLAATIDKYVTVTASRRYDGRIRVAVDPEHYADRVVDSVDEVEHPIVREALRMMRVDSNVELHAMADVPGRSGLGSSGAFGVAVVQALDGLRRNRWATVQFTAIAAWQIEKDRLGEPVGIQDPAASACGGLVQLENRGYAADRLPIDIAPLESRLLILDTGVRRVATSVLKEQQRNIVEDAQTLERMHRIKSMAADAKRIFERGAWDEYGAMLHEHWTLKQQTATSMSDQMLDAQYESARKAGALGGKIIGAGGGGFWMFYARPEKRDAVIAALPGCRELRWRFEHRGAHWVEL